MLLLLTFNFTILQKEHLAIRARKMPEDPIDWNDLKSMRFTRAVRDHSLAFCSSFSLLIIVIC